MIRKIFTILLLVLLLKSKIVSAQIEGGCGCNVDVAIFNNGIGSQLDLTPGNNGIVTIFLNPGDSLRFYASSIHDCYTGIFLRNGSDTLFWGGNNDGISFSTYDTGHYYFWGACEIVNFYVELDVIYYFGTGIHDNDLTDVVKVIPSVSKGVFKVDASEKKLKEIVILNSMGLIVLKKEISFSEFDISNFSSGIYYYVITDEMENVWRGKIIKE